MMLLKFVRHPKLLRYVSVDSRWLCKVAARDKREGIPRRLLHVFHVGRQAGWEFYSRKKRSQGDYFSDKLQKMGIKSLRRWSLSMTKLVQERGASLLDSQEQTRFERLVLPHLDAAFNLARWLLRKRADAEDVTQEAMLRAYKFFPGFHGGEARAWLLQIVRNTSYTWMEKNRDMEHSTEFEEELY